MRSKLCLTLDDARRAAAGARDEALRQGWAVTIAVADDGGHLLTLERLDGCPAASVYIATEKARSSVLGRRESGAYEEVINNGRTAFLSAPVLKGMMAGGVPIFHDGQLLGAVGVSGVKAEQDVQIARAGVAAIGDPPA